MKMKSMINFIYQFLNNNKKMRTRKKAFGNKELKTLTTAWEKSGFKTYTQFAKVYAPGSGRSEASIIQKLSSYYRNKKIARKVRNRATVNPEAPVQYIVPLEQSTPVIEEQMVFNEELPQEAPMVGIVVNINGKGIKMEIMAESIEFLNNQVVCRLKHV